MKEEMIMVKKILVPTDGSAYSHRALSTAVEYAEIFNAEIEILAVIPDNPYGMYDKLKADDALAEREKKLALAQQIFDVTSRTVDYGNIGHINVISYGNPADEIINEIKKKSVDLVIMGGQGRSPLVGALVGSVTQRILSYSPVPVLVVK